MEKISGVYENCGPHKGKVKDVLSFPFPFPSFYFPFPFPRSFLSFFSFFLSFFSFFLHCFLLLLLPNRLLILVVAGLVFSLLTIGLFSSLLGSELLPENPPVSSHSSTTSTNKRNNFRKNKALEAPLFAFLARPTDDCSCIGCYHQTHSWGGCCCASNS